MKSGRCDCLRTGSRRPRTGSQGVPSPRLQLVVDGKVVRSETGPNDRPGGSERLDWASWDVADLAGATAVLQIIDARTGGWGHVNVDHILQSDRRWQAVPAELLLDEEKRYLLLLPVAGVPRQFGDWAFSGSAVVDKANTAGWQQGAEPPLVAAFTSTGRGECILSADDSAVRIVVALDAFRNPHVRLAGRGAGPTSFRTSRPGCGRGHSAR